MEIKQLIENRTGALTGVEAIIDKAKTENRNLTPEEMTKVSDLQKSIDELEKEINLQERAIQQKAVSIHSPSITVETVDRDMKHREAFRDWVCTNVVNREWLAGTDNKGGYTVPRIVYEQVITKMKKLCPAYSLANVLTFASGKYVTFPAIDDSRTATRVTEVTTTSADSGNNFAGSVAMTMGYLSAVLSISDDFARTSVVDFENLLSDYMARQFAYAMESEIISGDGTNNGCVGLTDSSYSIHSTACASTSAVAYDDFVNCKHALKAEYWNNPNTCWIMHQDLGAEIRKLKEATTNRPLWTELVTEADRLTAPFGRLLGIPVYYSAYAPSFASAKAGDVIAIVGDMRSFIIPQGGDMYLEPYRSPSTASTIFYARQLNTGKVVNEDAFELLALAAS